MSGHLDGTNVGTFKCPTWEILTKFHLEKNFCSSIPGHVLSRIAKSRGCLVEIVRARPVLGTWIVPICFPTAKDWFWGLWHVLTRTSWVPGTWDLAFRPRTWPGTVGQKLFSKSNLVKMSDRTFVPSKCPAGHSNVRLVLRKISKKKNVVGEQRS